MLHGSTCSGALLLGCFGGVVPFISMSSLPPVSDGAVIIDLSLVLSSIVLVAFDNYRLH